MIYYPLPHPTSPGFRTVKLRMQNVVGKAQSPFTGQAQTYGFPGEWWEADVSLPKMLWADARAWRAWLAALRGGVGTFPLGDPTCRAPQGNGGGAPLMPLASSLSPAMSTQLLVAGCGANVPWWLAPGDYLEIGRNFLAYPNNPSNAAWTKAGYGGVAAPTIVNAAALAPDGSSSAYYVAFPATSSSEFSDCFQAVVPPILAPGQQFYGGIWLHCSLAISIGLTLTETSSGSAFAAQECALSTGWQFFEISGPLPANATGVGLYLISSNLAAANVYMWGASLDDGLTRHRLHQVLTVPPNTDAYGNVTLDIWPRLRETPDEAAPVNVQSARGMFRLAKNQRELDLSFDQTAGIDFQVEEAI
jgi:hypothetical protein